MNRRSFLKALLAVPAVASVALSDPPKAHSLTKARRERLLNGEWVGVRVMHEVPWRFHKEEGFTWSAQEVSLNAGQGPIAEFADYVDKHQTDLSFLNVRR